jgi:hypothetical protein
MSQLQNAVQFYYDHIGKAYPPYAGQHARWVLSTTTIEGLFREQKRRDEGRDLTLEEMESLTIGTSVLCGLPIRIDDSVEGFSYEYV